MGIINFNLLDSWGGQVRVLIGCEESQVVCKAFRALGHEAYSCDIQECSGGHPEWHIQGNVLDHLNDGWDLGIFHPDCTYITNSGVCHLHKDAERWLKLFKATEFFNKLLGAGIEKIAIENPIPHKYAAKWIDKKYSQIIQPWMFGHTEQKATCLWLKNLPELKPTNNVKAEMMLLPDNERQRLHYLPPSPGRAKERSKTYSGIGRGMASQWGKAT